MIGEAGGFIMERSALKEFMSWKNKKNRKPLLVTGVRQCGKTYLIKEFGKNEFSDMAYFNFDGNELEGFWFSKFESGMDEESECISLSLTKKCVDLLRGEIHFDSYYGAGSTFYVSIPQGIANELSLLQSV